MVMRKQCELCNNYDDVHAKDCPVRILEQINNGALDIRGPVKCYNGCYDSATQRTMDFQDFVMKKLKEREPDAHCTYFPAPGYHMVHKWGHPISGECGTRGAALAEAFRKVFDPQCRHEDHEMLVRAGGEVAFMRCRTCGYEGDVV